MKKSLVILFVLMFLFACVSCSNETVDPLQEIEGQELINKSTSPSAEYIIKAYRNNGGATVDWAVLCTLTVIKTGKTKNIYWQYHEREANIEWVDDDTAKINDVILNLPEDTYDWRNK